MDAEVFTDQKVLDLISTYYVPVRLDADKKQAEMQSFSVSGLPTIVLADAETKPLETLVGFQDASQVAAALEKAAEKR